MKSYKLTVRVEDLEAMHSLARTILNKHEDAGTVDPWHAEAVELARLVENALEEPAR